MKVRVLVTGGPRLGSHRGGPDPPRGLPLSTGCRRSSGLADLSVSVDTPEGQAGHLTREHSLTVSWDNAKKKNVPIK